MISDVLGIKTKIIRPPYGSINSNVMDLLIEIDYECLQWSYNTFDWVAENGKDILEGMTEQIRNGEIILLHSYKNKKPTVEILPKLIDELRIKGF